MNTTQGGTNVKKWVLLLGFIGLIISGVIFQAILWNTSQIQKPLEYDQGIYDTNGGSIPHSSALNTLIFLLGENQTHTLRTNDFTFSGYTQKWVVDGFYNTSGIPVYPIINGVHFNGLDGENRTIFSGVEGYYEFSVYVNEAWDVAADYDVWANISETAASGIYTDPGSIQNSSILHDVTALTNISVLTNIVDFVMPGDSFYVKYNLTDVQGNPLETINLTAFQNYNLTNELVQYAGNSTDTEGKGYFAVVEENNMSAIGINFTGMGYTHKGNDTYFQYAPCFNSVAITRVELLAATVSTTNLQNSSETNVYTGNEMQVDGHLWANDIPALILANRDFELFIAGHGSVYNGTTDTNGNFSVTIDLAAAGYLTNDSFTLLIRLQGYDSTLQDNTSEFIVDFSVFVVDQPPPSVPPLDDDALTPTELTLEKLIIPGIILAVLIVGLVLFQRFRMDKTSQLEKKLRKVDYSRFASINLLYNQGRRREAIAYTYKIFSDLIYEKYGLAREKAQTLRKFGILCVMKYGLDPLRTYPYIALVENVIYGAFDLDLDTFQKSIIIFGRVFQEITGTLLDFTLETPVEASTGETTIKIGVILD
jgi:hypothetical protein